MSLNFGLKGLFLVSACCLPVASFSAHLEGSAEVLSISEALTLNAVLEKALQHSVVVPQFAIEEQKLEAEKGYADAWLVDKPSLGLAYQSDVPLTDQGLENWELSLNLPLWKPAQKRALQSALQGNQQWLQHKRQALRLQLSGQLRERLWNLVISDNDYQMVEQAWKSSQQLEQDVAKRVRLGELAKRDLLLAQEEALMRRGELFHAEENLKNALHQYELSTGIDQLPAHPEEQPVVLADDHLQQHPERLKIESELNQLRQRLKSERLLTEGSPELQFILRSETFSRGEPAVESIGVAVVLPFGASSKAASLQVANDLTIAELNSQLEQLKRDLSHELHHAEHALQISREALKAALQRHELLQENVRLTRAAFNAGEVDLVELLRVQAQAFAVERNLRTHRLQLQREIARFNQAAGVSL